MRDTPRRPYARYPKVKSQSLCSSCRLGGARELVLECLLLELPLAMGAGDLFMGKDLGRVFFRGSIRVAARHRDGERV